MTVKAIFYLLDYRLSPNVASSSLELIPNCDTEACPTKFSITFVEKNLIITYSLVVELGGFLAKNFDRKITKETLTVNDKLIFSRGEEFDVALPATIRHLSNKSIKRISPKTKEIAESSLVDTELFLTNGFKTIFAPDLVSLITDWFSNKFMVIYRSDAIKVMRKFAEPKKNTIYVEATLTEAAKEFGINSNALGYRASEESDDVVLCSIFNNNKITIPADDCVKYFV